MTDGRQYQAGEKTEDALAALDNQLMEAVMALNDCGKPNLADSVQEARRHLTASDTKTHEDALAALGRLTDAAGYRYETADKDGDIVRHDLTASGVPEEVWRLPERWCEDAVAHAQMARGQTPVTAARYWGAKNMLDRCTSELEAAIASAPADGYKLVPVEPTERMIELGAIELSRHVDFSDSIEPPDSEIAAEIYSDMIAAAPTDGRE